MKTITLTNTGKSPQTVYVGEDEATIPTQQVTIPHTSKDNPRHPRNIQISNEFIFVKRFGSPTVAMHVDDFIKLCTNAEPQLSWPPVFKENKVTNGNPVIIESVFEEKNPELSDSDNALSFQWQLLGINNMWSNVEDDAVFIGSKTNKLTIQNQAGIPTKTLRCLATNGAGTRSSLPATSAPIPVTPAKA